tara:strand:+ start:189 stop:1136 length:948 start_codon:yes stop_codon:yes gene_type:complete
MKIYNAEPLGYSKKAITLWEQKGFNYRSGSWNEINKTQLFPNVKILIVRLSQNINPKTLNKFPELKIVISATTGLDHIDKKEINRRNINLVSLRGHNDFLKTIPSTAEHTWGLLLALIRNIPLANEHVKLGNWNRDLFKGLQLKNKTIGIIGMGRTGSRIARYADTFEMNIQYYDPFVMDSRFGVKVNCLDDILKQSDIISIHVHLSKETKHLLNAENLKNLKQNAYVINTSRGQLVDESALCNLLINKKISGVASDVLYNEFKEIHHNSLWKLQNKGYNIIITPHIGGATMDAMWACEEYLVNQFENINKAKFD